MPSNKDIKQEILEILGTENTAMTAQQLVNEMINNRMMDVNKQQVAQCLSTLKKDGILTSSQNHCDEEDKLLNFYEINSKADIAEELKDPSKATQVKQDQPPQQDYSIAYEVVTNEYGREAFIELTQAQNRAHELSKLLSVAVPVFETKAKLLGNVIPVVNTEFKAA